MILTFTPSGIETFFEETLELALDPSQPPPDNVEEVVLATQRQRLGTGWSSSSTFPPDEARTAF